MIFYQKEVGGSGKKKRYIFWHFWAKYYNSKPINQLNRTLSVAFKIVEIQDEDNFINL